MSFHLPLRLDPSSLSVSQCIRLRPLDTMSAQVDPSVVYGDTDPMSPSFETPSRALRDHVDRGAGRSPDRPDWWGKPLAVAGGFADWEPVLAKG